MAKTPEEKAADAIIRTVIDSNVNRAAAAEHLVDNTTNYQHAALFDFAMHIIAEFASDSMHGSVSMDRAERYMIANAVKDALRKEGYTLR